MAKIDAITYPSVAKICNEMLKSGEQPTVRKLHERLRGSHTTLSEHLNQWRAQQALAQSSENELSVEFTQALMAEFSRITASVKNQLNAQLSEKEGHLTEARELLAENEAKWMECDKQRKDEQDKFKSAQLTLEKQLAVAMADAESSKKRESILQEKVDLLIEKCHQAELKAAIAETKVAEHAKNT